VDFVLCPGCGNDIPVGEGCPICREGRSTPRVRRRLCSDCGAALEPGGRCPQCERAARRATTTELCLGCGNEIQLGQECPICKHTKHKRSVEGRATRMCPSCGNDIFEDEPCPICSEGRAIRSRGGNRVFCAGCGNAVDDSSACPVCDASRSPVQPRHDGPTCPQCDEGMEKQDWDGVIVHMCMSCQGTLFPPRGLESTLDKLREGCDDTALPEILAEFKERRRLALPKSVRYKPCPTCGVAMTRRNYAGVSGVIVEVCGRHGTWITQTGFGDLTDFVTRGGDAFAARLRGRPR